MDSRISELQHNRSKISYNNAFRLHKANTIKKLKSSRKIARNPIIKNYVCKYCDNHAFSTQVKLLSNLIKPQKYPIIICF